MGARYDPDHIRSFFDAYAEQEWARLEADAPARVSFHLHRRFLERHVRPGDRVLEVGAGPGRFTIELARLGARLTVTDLSPVQLDLNRARTAEAGVHGQVEAWREADVTDLGAFPDGAFDAAIAFGGPLSYALDRRDRAMQELLRVTRPGGVVLLSVMSLGGATRRFLPGVLDIARAHGAPVVERVLRTGDLAAPDAAPTGHYCHLFRWAELEAFLRSHGGEILEASAANFLSLQNEAALADLQHHATLWPLLLRAEEELAREPGALDAGTHIIAAFGRPSS